MKDLVDFKNAQITATYKISNAQNRSENSYIRNVDIVELTER